VQLKEQLVRVWVRVRVRVRVMVQSNKSAVTFRVLNPKSPISVYEKERECERERERGR
jgi:hypothetical protein